MHSHTDNKPPKTLPLVLILVVMEDALALRDDENTNFAVKS